VNVVEPSLDHVQEQLLPVLVEAYWLGGAGALECFHDGFGGRVVVDLVDQPLAAVPRDHDVEARERDRHLVEARHRGGSLKCAERGAVQAAVAATRRVWLVSDHDGAGCAAVSH
jgi:hypothetical protein